MIGPVPRDLVASELPEGAPPARKLRILALMPDEMSLLGVASMLQRLPLVATVHTARTADEGRRFLRTTPVDVCLVSAQFELPFLTEVAALAAADGVKLVVTLRSDESAMTLVRSLPAAGYLLEAELTGPALHRALIDLIAVGTVSMPLATLHRLLVTEHAESPTPSPRLSRREREVLGLLAAGASNKEIASALGISIHGAKRHVTNLIAKLNCANRTAVVSLGIKLGLVSSGGVTQPGVT